MPESTPSQAALGALFDWDGVVIDSSRQHERSWEMLAAEKGLELTPGFFKASFGMKNEAIIPGILRWTEDAAEIRGHSLRKEELYRALIRDEGISPLPGVRTFLERLRDAGIPCVIASSSHRVNIELCLGMFGFEDFFRDIVSAENVGRGKPDPEVFLKAAQVLGIEPGNCVVFEDATVGIQAALAGGMRVVGVAGTHPPGTLSGAHHIVERLDLLTSDDLRALWTARADA